MPISMHMSISSDNMLSIKGFPSNKEQFVRLVEFCKGVIDICDEQSIKPVVYGGLAVFAYTKNTRMSINDIDMLIEEKEDRFRYY